MVTDKSLNAVLGVSVLHKNMLQLHPREVLKKNYDLLNSTAYTGGSIYLIQVLQHKPCTHGNDLHMHNFCMYANFAYVSKNIFALRLHGFLKSVESVKN